MPLISFSFRRHPSPRHNLTRSLPPVAHCCAIYKAGNRAEQRYRHEYHRHFSSAHYKNSSQGHSMESGFPERCPCPNESALIKKVYKQHSPLQEVSSYMLRRLSPPFFVRNTSTASALFPDSNSASTTRIFPTLSSIGTLGLAPL